MKTYECCCFRVNRDNRANIGYIVYTRKLAETKVWLSAEPTILLLILYLPRRDPE